MPLWLEETIAGVSVLVFVASGFVLMIAGEGLLT
jgi:hypothetical protein